MISTMHYAPHCLQPASKTEQGKTQASDWDAFLEANPCGQFQQSSGWGRVKATEGWNSARVFENSGSTFCGGWQILWKTTRLGRIGFINKGPVLQEETSAAIAASLEGIATHARSLRLRALILQPPDFSCISGADLCRHEFLDVPISGVIDSTLLADVTGSIEAMQRRISRRVLQESKNAVSNGVTIRAGGREDLPEFFDLMSETCKRRGVSPNPGSLKPLQTIWDAFHPKVRLELASVNGSTVGGLLMIGFGNRLSFWKKGWNGKEGHAHPNSALNVASLRWANAEGYKVVDFAGCDHDFALAVLEERPLTQAQQRSRDVFNLRLGAEPRLLTPAQILIMNRGARTFVNTVLRVPVLRKAIQVGCRKVRA